MANCNIKSVGRHCPAAAGAVRKMTLYIPGLATQLPSAGCGVHSSVLPSADGAVTVAFDRFSARFASRADTSARHGDLWEHSINWEMRRQRAALGGWMARMKNRRFHVLVEDWHGERVFFPNLRMATGRQLGRRLSGANAHSFLLKGRSAHPGIHLDPVEPSPEEELPETTPTGHCGIGHVARHCGRAVGAVREMTLYVPALTTQLPPAGCGAYSAIEPQGSGTVTVGFDRFSAQLDSRPDVSARHGDFWEHTVRWDMRRQRTELALWMLQMKNRRFHVLVADWHGERVFFPNLRMASDRQLGGQLSGANTHSFLLKGLSAHPGTYLEPIAPPAPSSGFWGDPDANEIWGDPDANEGWGWG